jgi:hypothetical protein
MAMELLQRGVEMLVLQACVTGTLVRLVDLLCSHGAGESVAARTQDSLPSSNP